MYDAALYSHLLFYNCTVSNWLKKGSNNSTFDGDTYLTVRLLLPGFVKRVYNINSKQLVKLFSQVHGVVTAVVIVVQVLRLQIELKRKFPLWNICGFIAIAVVV